MKQYYNIAASLPFLSYDFDVYPTRQEFLERSLPWLDDDDSSVLEQLTAETDDFMLPTAVIADVLPEYQEFELLLRRRLAESRAAVRQQELDEHANGFDFSIYDSDVAQAVTEWSNQHNPLEAERQLDRARWRKLDELQVGHYFDVRFLCIYAVKLLLLERNARFTREQGTENFNSAYSTIWADIQQHVPKTESGANV